MGHGFDPKLVYVRSESEHFIRHTGNWQQGYEDFGNLPNGERGSFLDIDFRIIGFCGVLYPLVRIIERAKRIPYDSTTTFFYSYEDYKDWRQQDKPDWKSRKTQEFFERFAGKRMDAKFVEVDAPVFIVDYRHRKPEGSLHGGQHLAIVTNPCLKDWGFGKVKDAYTAFQDISMYLGNQLVKEHKPDEIEDKYRIAQHGFDKTSFRHPTRLKDLKNT